MIEKISHIKNPLSVIAIFAAIAEISGTTVLPFVTPENQSIYIWFLMFFPFFLVGIFFITLNFNRDALYAPSDYKDEKNFIFHRINKYHPDDYKSSFNEIKTVLDELKHEEDIKKLHNEIDSLKMKVEQASNTEVVQTQISQNELIIDLNSFGEGLIATDFKATDSFQALLDSIYFEFLQNLVPVYSYGEKWQLIEIESGKVFRKRGIRGIRDSRSLSEVGISKNKSYKVELL